MCTVTYTYVSSKNYIQAHIHGANILPHIKVYFSERLGCATRGMSRSRRLASNFVRNKNKTWPNYFLVFITDLAKLDVVSDGLLHNQLLNFCQNARMTFLGRNTPTPLLSEFMAQVDDTIVEVVCRHGTWGGHVDWSLHLCKFAHMKIQVPHFRGGFGITPNEGSAISAFYSATCALVVWLGSHGGNKLSWHAPVTSDCQGGITCTSWLRVTNQHQAM